MKSKTSPLGNPVSACGAGDAGIENAPYGFDPSGVAQRGNSRLYGDERAYRIRGIGVRVVRKGRKRGAGKGDFRICAGARGRTVGPLFLWGCWVGKGRADPYPFSLVCERAVVQTPNPLT